MNNQNSNAMSLMKRMLLLVVLFVLVLTIVPVMTLHGLSSVLDAYKELRNDNRLLNLIAKQQLFQRNLDYIVTRIPEGRNDDAIVADLLAGIANIETEAGKVLSNYDDPARLYVEFKREKLRELWKSACETVGLALTADKREGDAIMKDLESRRQALADCLSEQEYFHTHPRLTSPDGEHIAKNVQMLTLGVGSAGVALTMLIGYLILRALVKKLRSIIDGMYDAVGRIEEAGDAMSRANTVQPEDIAAIAATLAGTTDDLDSLVNGNGGVDPFGQRNTRRRDAIGADRQYQTWSNIPPDIRSALLILARRIDNGKKDVE